LSAKLDEITSDENKAGVVCSMNPVLSDIISMNDYYCGQSLESEPNSMEPNRSVKASKSSRKQIGQSSEKEPHNIEPNKSIQASKSSRKQSILLPESKQSIEPKSLRKQSIESSEKPHSAEPKRSVQKSKSSRKQNSLGYNADSPPKKKSVHNDDLQWI